MRAIVPLILLGSMVFVAVIYLNASNPYLLADIKEALGSQPAVASVEDYNHQQAERDRTNKINALLISDLNKRDLREGRPFWGAAQHMIELAMSSTADSAVVRSDNGNIIEFQVFGFEGKRDPIIFEFHTNKLSCAHYPVTKQTTCAPKETSFYPANFPFDAMLAQN